MTIIKILAFCALGLASPAAKASCGYLWNDKSAEMECRLREAAQAQEQIDNAAMSRRLYESFPDRDRSGLSDWMIRRREEDARQQLDDALRR